MATRKRFFVKLDIQQMACFDRIETAPAVNNYTLQADEFAAVVRGERPPRFPASDAVLNMRVVEACLRSAEQRERIKLG